MRPQVCSVLVRLVSRYLHHNCHSWQHTGVVHLSLQADGKVAFEDVPVFGVCRPDCHDSSLYLFVLVLFLEAVVLSQVYVAFNIFYQHIVNVYWVLSTTFVFRSICCSSCGVSLHKNLSLAIWQRSRQDG